MMAATVALAMEIVAVLTFRHSHEKTPAR